MTSKLELELPFIALTLHILVCECDCHVKRFDVRPKKKGAGLRNE